MELLITRYIQFQDRRVWLNGIVNYVSEAGSVGKFIRSVYRHYNIDYPRFFKMDNLSRLGFLSAEILLRGTELLQKYPSEEVAIILENASSSLDTDEKHQESIRDRNKYYPSPSVFVYTLANITASEIAIRHKMKGENAVFIFEQFDPGFMYHYVFELFRNQQVNCCLSGWLECYGDHCRSFLFIVEQEDKMGRFKEPQEYVILNALNMEELFKGRPI
jgi:hypothetical protein